MAAKTGKKAKKDKKGARVRSGHTNPHKVAEFANLSGKAAVDPTVAAIRKAITGLRKSLFQDLNVPSNKYVTIVRIEPKLPKGGVIVSGECGCGCS